ncbi:hypothetical protein GCM10027321_34460 [Massilia terrae]|uniref:Lipoprotein n=1 Tax=Massilia terrae TaxID=1811224 RepID=A0ABT2CVS5_9BURK|nr:hypothetical protein [Massilia terrae]MCS0658044.1 hypothetical protein [Massilia terrae]
MRVLFCCLLLAAACEVSANPVRVGEAEVRASANGEPCFTISEREEQRRGAPDFDAVTVTDPHARKPLLWRMAMPAERTFPVNFSMCIPYGGRVQALPQSPAAKLEPGRVYQVRIEARGTAQAYEARFCLVRQGGGVLVVRHIGADAHEGRHLYGCLSD